MTWVFLHSILTTSMKPRNLMSNKNFDVLKYIHHITRFLINTIFMMMKKLQKLWPESIFRILLISWVDFSTLKSIFTTFYCRRFFVPRPHLFRTVGKTREFQSEMKLSPDLFQNYLFFYLQPLFSTFSRRSSSTTSQARLCAYIQKFQPEVKLLPVLYKIW